MSKISDLAKSFEEKSKQQVNDTEQSLKNEFSKHEKFIKEALRSNEQKIKSDIASQSLRISGLLLRGWLWMAISVILILCACWGVIWLQGQMILDNYIEISRQNMTLEKLESEGGKLEMSRCGKEKRFCIKMDLSEQPYGKNGNYPWMIPEGY